MMKPHVPSPEDINDIILDICDEIRNIPPDEIIKRLNNPEDQWRIFAENVRTALHICLSELFRGRTNEQLFLCVKGKKGEIQYRVKLTEVGILQATDDPKGFVDGAKTLVDRSFLVLIQRDLAEGKTLSLDCPSEG